MGMQNSDGVKGAPPVAGALQFGAVCCKCVTVCCIVVQYVAVWCSVLVCKTVTGLVVRSLLQVCCSVLHCVEVCCSVL